MKELIFKLNSIAQMSDGLEKRLRCIIQPLHIKAGQHILVPGQTCRQIFYVQKGLIRIYHKIEEKEISDWFITNKDICISVSSFFDQIPSEEFHIAIEDCECWGITFDELLETYKLYPEFNVHGRQLITEYYVMLDKRSSFLKRQTPYKKYERLLKDNPDFLTRITIKDMASYLDISDRTFKRIKQLYIKKNAGDAARRLRSKN